MVVQSTGERPVRRGRMGGLVGWALEPTRIMRPDSGSVTALLAYVSHGADGHAVRPRGLESPPYVLLILINRRRTVCLSPSFQC